MIVLGIDASSDAAAAAIVADGVLLCEHTLNNGKNHSVKLLPMVENMLAETGLDFADIDVYACGVGPGSFTGVRIGVATIKGFAQSWNKPVVEVSSLAALAENLRGYEGIRVAAVHARVDELFCAAYDSDDEPIIEPCVMKIHELKNALEPDSCMLVGNGALMNREVFVESLGENAIPTSCALHVIRGGAVAELGYKLAAQGITCSYEQAAPVYLRVSQAEREYNEKNKK
ncbi:MAG: tRNA (adenosine(37)-N6)-threonylcarbamoyltransferase complex dimerization subunit type 1 TsaB [Ruminococcaceae bacterium]|nr:tRNA (adenosine(37)-N6)-threonylcarbamoyltransferase complex dimerization subunit type 1 TsaB [Oscillospiraceae bacterium]